MPLPLNPRDLASLIEHQLLKPDASRAELEIACAEARKHGFQSLCVNGCRVAEAAALLDEGQVKVATVVGFPFGAMDADAKRYETEVAIDNGAQEIELVPNIGWLKDGQDSALLRELRDVVEAADERPVGVVLETPLLGRDETIRACHLIEESGAKAVIISTGFWGPGTTAENVKSVRELVASKCQVVANRAKLDRAAVLALIESGATRVATTVGPNLLADF
jgi:deoxyribose-phosphate aldolase